MSDSEDWNIAKSKRKHANKQKLQKSNIRGRKPRQELPLSSIEEIDVSTNSLENISHSETPSDIRKIDIALSIAEKRKNHAMSDFTPYLLCGICKGYLIGAVTVRDCIHSFCRSCIYQFVQKEQQCPTCCALESNKEHPVLKHNSIQFDSALQSLVFKMVPGLFANELQRVEEFYKSKGILDPPREYPEFLSPDDTLSLSIEYFKIKEEEEDNGFECDLSKRYLQCPAAVTIGHLMKLIRLKYELNACFAVDVIYNNEILIQTLTLMDVVYIHQWHRMEPMAFYYRVYKARIPPLQIKIVKPSLNLAINELQLNNLNNGNSLKSEPVSPDDDLPLSEAIKKIEPVIPLIPNNIINNVEAPKTIKPNHEVQPLKPTKLLKIEVSKLNMNNKPIQPLNRSVLKSKDPIIKPKNNVKLKQESIRPAIKTPLKSFSSREPISLHFNKPSEKTELQSVPVNKDDKFVKTSKEERSEKVKEKIDVQDVYKFTNEKIKEKEKYKYGRDKDKYKDRYAERKMDLTNTERSESEVTPNMQPRVDLTEYARNIGLTAVKNTTQHFNYQEKDADREQYEFARKRDREWAQQKYLDEKLHKHESHKRKKKAKHIKNEESKRPKLHAEITSPESCEDLKLKVKLTPCKHKHHKHHSDHSGSKLSVSPVPSTSLASSSNVSPVPPPPIPIKKSVPALSMPIIPIAPAASAAIEPSSKERLLQMRQVRKDKHVNVTSTTPKNAIIPVPLPEVFSPTEQRRTDIPNLIPAQDIINGFTGFKQNMAGKMNENASKSGAVMITKPPLLAPQRPIVNQNGKRPAAEELSNPHKITKMENKMVMYNPRAMPETSRKQLPIILPPASISVTKMAEGQISPPLLKPVEKRPNLEIMLISSPERDSGTSRPGTPRTPQTISLLKIKNSAEAANGVKKQPPTKVEKPGDSEVTIHVEIPGVTKNPICDNIGALDLSGKSTRSPNSESCSSPEQVAKPGPPKLNRIATNGVPNHVKKLESDKSENPMSNLEMLSESAVQLLNSEQRVPPIRHNTSNLNLQKISSTLRIPMPARQPFKPGSSSGPPTLQRTVPRLNEIRATRPINARPQNQTVRSIPNPSALSFRQNQIRPVTSDNAKTGNSQNAAFPHRSPTSSQQPDGFMSPKALEPPTDIKKMETIAKNIHIEKVTAGLAVRASEANGKTVNPILKARCARALHIGGAPIVCSSSGELL